MAKEYTPSSRNREAFEAMTETAGNVPPQAVELEEAVLGALMLEKDSIIAVQEYVTPDAFYTEEHRTIYKAIEELSMELKPIDLYTVTERLKAKKELKKVGGASYLAQLTQKVGSAANVEFHAKIIAQKYVQRELIRSATEIQKRSYDESTDVTELIGYAEGEIFKVAEGHVKRSVQVSKDILARALMQIEEASKNTSAFNGVPSGFMAIDRVTLGWQLSDLIIIAARPSMGKTAFVLSMARNMAVDHEQGVAFFSLEMSSVQLMMRLIIAETGLNGNDVKSGRLTPEQWRHLESATKPLGAAPLFIDDTPALAAANVSVAMRDASDIARETADIPIKSSDLTELARIRTISQTLMDRINRNYRFIVGFNSALMASGFLGLISPSMSALLHNSSTMLICAKSMTPLTEKKHKRRKPKENN